MTLEKAILEVETCCINVARRQKFKQLFKLSMPTKGTHLLVTTTVPLHKLQKPTDTRAATVSFHRKSRSTIYSLRQAVQFSAATSRNSEVCRRDQASDGGSRQCLSKVFNYQPPDSDIPIPSYHRSPSYTWNPKPPAEFPRMQ